MYDSYERFFSEEYINKEKFFDFGIHETIKDWPRKPGTTVYRLVDKLIKDVKLLQQ